MPSFQKFDGKKFENHLELVDFEKFAQEFGVPEASGEELAKKYAQKIIDLINKYDLKEIYSSKEFGECMRFSTGTGCSVWYKKEGTILSPTRQKAFDEAFKIQANWYLQRNGSDTEELIRLYKE